MMAQLKDFVIVQPKSKIKAGEGLNEGEYKFFTSSNIQSKWLNQFQYNKPALIFGTGGIASVHYCDTPFSTSTDCIVMYSKGDFNLEYVYRYLESHMYILENGFKGVGLKHISKEYILSISIPEVDPYQQESLVVSARKIDEIICARQNQLTRVNELIKSRFIELFGDPVINSKNFITKKGIDLFKISNGKTVPNDKRFESGIPAYGGNGISWYTDNVLYDEDTIVIGRVGFQSGNVHLVKGPVWITDNAMYISEFYDDSLSLVFLRELMEQIDFTKQQDAGDLKKVTQKPFMEMEYILPSKELQCEYMAFVEQTDKLKFEAENSLEKLKTMKNAIMQQCFG